MAITTSPSYNWDPHSYESGLDVSFDVTEYAIGGKMVSATATLSAAKAMTFKTDSEFKNYLKSLLAQEIAHYIISANLIETTFAHLPVTDDVVLRGRCYLAPTDQIKILRMCKQ